MPRSGPVPHNQPITLPTAKLNTVEDGELNLTFAALADPTRRAILAHLARGEATVNVLAGPFEMSLQAVSRHLKVLEGAGLITRGRDAQFRPRSFREAPLREAADWIEHTREAWRQGMEAASEQPSEQQGTAPPVSAFATRGEWAR
jgi:DNA-binding transcriptional ArsR family regulator